MRQLKFLLAGIIQPLELSFLMNPVSIQCPNCKSEIAIDKALSHQFEETQKKKLEADFAARLLAEKKDLWKRAQEEAQKKISAQSEEELKGLKEEFERQKTENERKEKQLAEFRENELKLREDRRKIEEEKENLEIKLQRQLDEERKKIQEKVQAEAAEQFHLKEREKDQMIESLKRSLEEAQRKANQGSQQSQGEILELELENMLKAEFPLDEIMPVGKGINGADIVQKVFDKSGRHTGTIVWESKRTKNWDKSWVEKLKADLLTAKGDVAVLVSIVLPEGIKNFGFKDGIYVTSFECFLAVAYLLRKSIIDHHSVKLSVVGKNEKMEMVYNYFLSSEFQQRVSAIAEAFSAMKSDLDTEKRVFAKLWAKREKEIEKVILNTSSLHGELHGLIGEQLPTVKALETDTLLLEIEEN